MLAGLYRAGQRWDQAGRAYQQALARQPLDPSLQISLGRSLAMAGRTGEAEQAYRAAISLKSENAEAWLALGQLHAQTRDWKEAVADFTAALVADPQASEAKSGLAAAMQMWKEKNLSGSAGSSAGASR
jgi:tetratricopeptide (TPR) repeat protein